MRLTSSSRYSRIESAGIVDVVPSRVSTGLSTLNPTSPVAPPETTTWSASNSFCAALSCAQLVTAGGAALGNTLSEEHTTVTDAPRAAPAAKAARAIANAHLFVIDPLPVKARGAVPRASEPSRRRSRHADRYSTFKHCACADVNGETRLNQFAVGACKSARSAPSSDCARGVPSPRCSLPERRVGTSCTHV